MKTKTQLKAARTRSRLIRSVMSNPGLAENMRRSARQAREDEAAIAAQPGPFSAQVRCWRGRS